MTGAEITAKYMEIAKAWKKKLKNNYKYSFIYLYSQTNNKHSLITYLPDIFETNERWTILETEN